MKIFIDKNYNHRFAQRMIPVWVELGHKAVEEAELNTDIQLCFTRMYKKTRLPKVQRLDGIYYDKATDYKSRNRGHSELHVIAQGIIYQSEYSKRMCDFYLSKPVTNIKKIIYNGISTDWQLKYKSDGYFNIVSASRWRRHKRLPEIINIFKKAGIKNSKLHILGDLGKEKLIKDKNIIYYGRVDWEKMKNIYKSADVFVHLSKKDSCPNAVVEAIGAGIPILTTNACGGATEMAGLTSGCRICYGDDESIKPCFNYSDAYNILSKKLEIELINNLIEMSTSKIRVKLPTELTIEYAAKQYLNIFDRVLKGK
jgi:glycosyltransferase involved in cell wall biosynthesis